MRLRLDGRARRLLRRMPSAYSTAELALIAALGIQSARLVWTVATPVSPLGDWRPASAALPGSAYDVLTGFDPFFRLSGEAGPGQVTSLRLTLYGTRIDEAMGRGSAIVAGPDGIQKSVAIGEEVAPGVKLKAVAFDHVTLDRGGAAEDLFLDQSGGAAPVVPGAPAARPVGAAPIAAPAVVRLQSEIGFVPRLAGGRISGLAVHAQGSGAVFRQAGLREGDVVTAIGGRPVSGPADLDRVATDYAGGGNVPVVVERGTQTLSLSIPLGAAK
ncbi:type II secretion system protein N [Sphingomonas bacterium]|uniref:type II secretion system protein N n=1 Tax=Sphingomonas bacterium TaxID=1895847 RepID=UPI001576F17A|nr:type II secretion system protein N [Sphingomonas bacterium]